MPNPHKTPFPEAHKPAIRAFLATPAGQALLDWAKTPNVPEFEPDANATLEKAALHGAYSAGFRAVLPALRLEIGREAKPAPTPSTPSSIT